MHSFLVAVAVAAHLSLPPEWLLPPHRPANGGQPCPTRVRVHFSDVPPEEASVLDGEYATIEEAAVRAELILRAGYWTEPRPELGLVALRRAAHVTIHPGCWP